VSLFWDARDGGKPEIRISGLARPALNRMQPFRNLQLAEVVCLARLLADYDTDRIPDERRVLVRRLAVVAC
jgi:hypothetical protein